MKPCVSRPNLCRRLAQRGLELIYGGGSIGLMGEVARAAKANGGRVHGVITERLRDLEQGWEEADVWRWFPTCTRVTHDRTADGFVVLSGHWDVGRILRSLGGRLLGEHSGPIGLLRDGPMNDGLLELIERGTTWVCSSRDARFDSGPRRSQRSA